MEKDETHFSYRDCLSAFFFGRRGAKKKAWQKRNAYKGVSPLRSVTSGTSALVASFLRKHRLKPTLRALDQRELLKKLDQNFPQAAAKLQFINHYAQ